MTTRSRYAPGTFRVSISREEPPARGCYVIAFSDRRARDERTGKAMTDFQYFPDVPEIFQKKLACLRMLKTGDSIAGVGVRATADTYYIELTEDDINDA